MRGLRELRVNGWLIRRTGDEISVCAPDATPGMAYVSDSGRLEARLLYGLAETLLAPARAANNRGLVTAARAVVQSASGSAKEAVAMASLIRELDRIDAAPPAAAPDEAMVLRGARSLCRINAESCNVDVDDKWMLYSEEYKQEARTMLIAALTGAAPVAVEYEFEVWQDDSMQAGGSTTTLEAARGEAEHYALMYGQDGPVEVKYYERRELPSTTPSTGTAPGES